MTRSDGLDPLTVGVEEEYLLVDASTRLPVPRAEAVLRETDAASLRATVKRELQRSQVEATTTVCTSVDEVGEQLTAARAAVGAAASSMGTRVLSVGHPLLEGAPPGVSEGERFDRIVETYAAAIVDYQACGCHVHVGVPDRDDAVAVLPYLRPWLPTLLALSANSPVDRGRDTGFDSWRYVQQTRFPGPRFAPFGVSTAAYDRAVDELVDLGVVIDRQMSFWLARVSEHLPTVEFRVADAALTVDDALLQTALCRALVSTALDDIGSSRPAPDVGDQRAAAGVWAAARHGIGGAAVDPWTGRLVPAVSLVDRLINEVDGALDRAGDRGRTHDLVERTLATGNGATRLRATAGAAGSAVDLVDAAARLTCPVGRLTSHAAGRPAT